jgi:prolyl oligopeptidase
MTLIPSALEAQKLPAPPPSRVENVKETLHGVELTDPYRWLEDQESPATRAWINAQMDYAKSLLGNYSGRKAIEERLTQLIKIDRIEMPRERGGRYFYFKRKAEQAQPVLYMRKGARGKEEVLLDPNTMSADQTTSVQLLDIIQDGSLIAYGVQQGGEDEVEVHLLDTNTKKELADTLPKGRYFGGVSVRPDRSGIYYGRQEQDGPRVRYHAMGTDTAKDPEIFGKGYDAGKIIGTSLSADGRHLICIVYYGSAAAKTEVYVQDVAGNAPMKTIVNDIEARFEGDIVDDDLYVLTNWNAPNGRILKISLKNPERAQWKEIVPTEKENVIDYFTLAGGQVFVHSLKNVSSHVRIFDPEGKSLGTLKLPALGSVNSINGRWESKEVFFNFASFPIPLTIFRYDTEKKRRTVWAKIKTPVDTDKIEVRQVFYPSRDGTQIPMFLVHRKGLKMDGKRPVYMTGYGGFNASLTPYFSSIAAMWAESGGVYVVPNLRGGGEFGEEWHKAGMLDKKQNVFDDFISAAEWLIKNNVTNPGKLAIEGGSNGGLLVGAALTQRPELFRAVVCAVPLLDMIRYHQFLVAKFWVPEYGSSEDPLQFKYLLAYSPYHNVKPGTKYPAVLFITGDADTRVAPLHARKMCALLQAATGSEHPVLLHYDTRTGHSGGKPVRKVIEDLTDELAFLYWQLDIPMSKREQTPSAEEPRPGNSH